MKKFLGAVGGFFKRTDYIFWILTIAASVYGFALINSVSRSADSEKGFLATQILAVGLGYICAVVISLMDYNVVCKFWYVFAAVGVLALVYTSIFGNPSCGHRRQGLDPHRRQNLSNVRAGKNLLYRHLRQALGRIEGTKQAENLFRGYDAVPPRAGSHWINPFMGDDGTALVFGFMFLIMDLCSRRSALDTI